MLIEELQLLIRNYRDSSTPTNGTIIDLWTETSERHASIYESLQRKFPDIGSTGSVRTAVNRCVTRFKTLRKHLLKRPAQLETFLAEVFKLPTASSCPTTPTSSPRTTAPPETPASPQTSEVNKSLLILKQRRLCHSFD